MAGIQCGELQSLGERGRAPPGNLVMRMPPPVSRHRCAGILYRVSAETPAASLRSGAMPQNRMNREEFFANLAPLDTEQRGKILWNLYWRGTAAARERIEGELDPPARERRKQDAVTPPDPMLATPDMWTGFADAYLAELDRIANAERPLTGRRAAKVMSSSSPEWKRSERTRNLARWNKLVSGHIDAERAERLANHPAFEGPDADFMRARTARRRGDIDAARTLIGTCLERLPGRQEFVEFAEEVGADLPPRAREMRAERAAVQAQLAQAYQGGQVSSV